MTRRFSRAFLTVGGLGLSPLSPGSLGALPAIAAAWLLRDQSWLLWALVCGALTLVAVALTNNYLRQVDTLPRHRRTKHKHDPQEIVMDEFVGCLIALAFVPWSWPWVLAAYVLFRGLDMGKPGLIGWIDRHVPGGWGIMGDDVVAGLLAGAALLFVQRLLCIA